MNEEIQIYTPTIEDFDFVIYEWVNNDINPFCQQADGWKKARIVFATPERAVLSKSEIDIRDKKGTLKYPIISITRTETDKPLAHDANMAVNLFPIPDHRGGAITITKRISQYSTSKFANNKSFQKTGSVNSKFKNKEIIYQFIRIPQPTFLECTYEILIVSNFQQQMNELVSPFMTKYGNINYFVLRRNNWTYEGFIQENFTPENNTNDFSDDERVFKTKCKIKLKGYIVEKNNNNQSTISIRENPVKIILKKEYVLKGTIDEYLEKLKK